MRAYSTLSLALSAKLVRSRVRKARAEMGLQIFEGRLTDTSCGTRTPFLRQIILVS